MAGTWCGPWVLGAAWVHLRAQLGRLRAFPGLCLGQVGAGRGLQGEAPGESGQRQQDTSWKPWAEEGRPSRPGPTTMCQCVIGRAGSWAVFTSRERARCERPAQTGN